MKLNTKLICYFSILNGIIMTINGLSLIYFTNLYFEKQRELGITNSSGNFLFYALELGFLYLVGVVLYQHYLYLIKKNTDLKKTVTSNFYFTFFSILISLLVLFRINVQLKANDIELTPNVEACIFYSKIIIGFHAIFIIFYLAIANFLNKTK